MIILAGIVALGIFAQWLSWRIKVPAILPLIIIGLLVGPISTLWTADGQKWIDPMYTADSPNGIFPDQYLFYFVSLAIGVILFEGGLSLRRREIKQVGTAILKLITLGSLVTFIGAGLAAHYIMGLTWSISFLFAALVIVTGPTVIAPILQNLPLNRKVATVLKWEGILIDPIGALVAVLVFEFIVSGQGTLAFTSHAFISFMQIVLIGMSLGVMAGLFLHQLLKRDWIPHYLQNVFTLALVLTVFVLSDILAHESGLLAVVLMGMTLGNLNVSRIKEILYFKESLSILLISMLFILLAANIDLDDMALLLNWNCLWLFIVIILVLRPLGVFLSTREGGLNTSEKLFISWVGPRGIVAAGIASLFGIKLTTDGVVDAEYITPLVFMVVLGTVLLNATTARFVARLLGVILGTSDGILFVGANKSARTIANYLAQNGRHVVLIDTNERSVRKASELGLESFEADIYSEDLLDNFELLDVGWLIAMTGNSSVNEYACDRYHKQFGEVGTYRLLSAEELNRQVQAPPHVRFLSHLDDFLNLEEVARDYPFMHEITLQSKAHFIALIQAIQGMPKTAPIFIKRNDREFRVIPHPFQEMDVEEGNLLVYMGKQLDEKDLAKIKYEMGNPENTSTDYNDET